MTIEIAAVLLIPLTVVTALALLAATRPARALGLYAFDGFTWRAAWRLSKSA